jgi:putative addiction module component (TIGR02574 family)
MSPAAADVLSSALSLPEAERLEVASALLESAEPPLGPTGDEWVAELRRRMAEVDAGTAVFTPWEVVRARVHQRVLGRADG